MICKVCSEKDTWFYYYKFDFHNIINILFFMEVDIMNRIMANKVKRHFMSAFLVVTFCLFLMLICSAINNSGYECAYADTNLEKVTGVGLQETSLNSRKLTWDKQESAITYDIYEYNSYTKNVKIRYAVGDVGEYEYENMIRGVGYSYKVRACGADGEKGEWSGIVKTMVKPSDTKLWRIKRNLPYYLINWYERNGSGYQLKYSPYSDMRKAKRITFKGQGKTYANIPRLSNGKRYYFKLRVFKTYGGKTKYSNWGKTTYCKARTTGWFRKHGTLYYYVNTRPLAGARKIGGQSCYFSRAGRLLGSTYDMWRKANKYKTNTGRKIIVSRKLHRTVVYKRIKLGKAGSVWAVEKFWLCSVGKASTPSPTTNLLLSRRRFKLLWFGDNIYKVWHATRYNRGYWFHSILYDGKTGTRVIDGRLGYSISHGCIRLATDNAKWVHDNIVAGTRCIVY